MRSEHGFTLIELMIVVAIIAIIAAIAIPSLLRSRMASNQTAAIASCKAYCEAQEIYHRTDYDNDAILEYAGTLQGAYSLLENTAGAGDLALIDRAFADAEGNPGTSQTQRAGYVFTVLTSQGANVAPGAQSWYSAGLSPSLIYGYGMSAVPAGYDTTGRDSYQINGQAHSYQRDRGVGDPLHVVNFNPDTTWAVTE
jgi:prepilin-type N-terminal cleavage/methylation domain-containing protein